MKFCQNIADTILHRHLTHTSVYRMLNIEYQTRIDSVVSLSESTRFYADTDCKPRFIGMLYIDHRILDLSYQTFYIGHRNRIHHSVCSSATYRYVFFSYTADRNLGCIDCRISNIDFLICLSVSCYHGILLTLSANCDISSNS